MNSIFDKAEQAKRAALLDQEQLAQGATKPILPIPPPQRIKDMQGTAIVVGHTVARALTGDHACIRICKVTGVNGDKIYLDDSRVPVKYPSRLLIID
jgi:hypothetical protein